MKGRAGSGGIPTDLLVCFPSRAHLALMPKPICSPSRPTDPSKRYLSRPAHRTQSSPLFRSKCSAVDDITDEPTSPKVTCAGQIKVRPRPSPGTKPSRSRNSKGWLSVVEEMEKLQSKKPLMQFLGALRSLRFDFNCFGSFHGAVDCSTDEEEEEAEDEEAAEEETEEEAENNKDSEESASKTIFSKWFMLLEENQSQELKKEIEEKKELSPPPNALLLMRCSSAPAQERAPKEQVEENIEEEKMKKERFLLMNYDSNFTDLSTEISKETWIVGNFDPLVRSRSWKR